MKLQVIVQQIPNITTTILIENYFLLKITKLYVLFSIIIPVLFERVVFYILLLLGIILIIYFINYL